MNEKKTEGIEKDIKGKYAACFLKCFIGFQKKNVVIERFELTSYGKFYELVDYINL